jgi:hypothetical protein
MNVQEIPDREWRFRWLVTDSWNRLHRITEGTITREEFVGVIGGRTLCGLKGDFMMPGILSRMGLRRCGHCCRKARIPCGDGAPFNAFNGRQQNA